MLVIKTRVVALLLSIIMVFSFAGCAFDERPSDQSGVNSGSSGNRPNNTRPHNNALSASNIASTLFPTFDSSRQVFVVDVTELDIDTVSLLKMIQGLVAKNESASIYYITCEADNFWMSYLKNELGVYFSEITVVQMLSMYADYVKTVVLYTPGTFEYEFAWNNALLRENAVCATYVAAKNCGLLYSAEVIDARGVFEDEQTAYDFMLDGLSNKTAPVITACSEYSRFADYAFACEAFMLPYKADSFNGDATADYLALLSSETPGVIYNDNSVNSDVLAVYSGAGYGSVPVGEFNNATVFSSIRIDYDFAPPKVQNGNGKKDIVYLSIIIDSDNIGDVQNIGYTICNTKGKSYKLSFEISPIMYRIAPSMLLWYSLNTRQKGDSLVASGGWTDIDQSAISSDKYKLWHNVNNYLIDNCGINISSSYKLRDVDDLTFDALTVADGVLCYNDINGMGEVDNSGKIPIISVNKSLTLKELEQCLEALNPNSNQPLYYACAIPVNEYFAKLPIYDGAPVLTTDRIPDGYYSTTEIVAVLKERLASSIKFVSPSQLMSYAKDK